MKILITRLLNSVFLQPLSFLWEKIYQWRRLAYKLGIFHQNKFQTPVISIGNLAFGGTGKTPVTIWISEYIEKLSKIPLILTRGHKGELEKKSGIIKANQNFYPSATEYGDEAVLMSMALKKGSVVVGRNRSENLEFYYHQVNPDVIILEDGHQHLKIARDLNIVLFDATCPIENLKVAPLGQLREGPTSLSDADLFMIGRCDLASHEKLDKLENFIATYAKKDPHFIKFKYEITALMDASNQKIMGPEQLKNKNIIAVSGIANPTSFYQMIESHGARIIKKVKFSDHYSYKLQDIENLIGLANTEKAIIITTEKDLVKLRNFSHDNRILALKITVKFIEGEEFLKEKIQGIVNQRSL